MFANCYDTIVGDTDFVLQADVSDCIARCDPLGSVGFNAVNKGIGTVPYAGNSFRHIIIGSQPDDDATYMRIINHCVTEATAQPATGTYVTGHVVKNRTPVISGNAIVASWTRLNTGTGHVSLTDWAPNFVATV